MRFSIIIPVFNAEAFLPKCLESILLQDYKDFEVICVNDGSTDSSIVILNDFRELFADKGIRFCIINQKNQGVSVARNTGMSFARNEWICFVDSDDIIEFNHLSSLTKALDCYPANLDVFMFRPTVVGLDGQRKLMISEAPESFELKGDVLAGLDNHPARYQICSCVWDKCWCREFLLKHEIYFLPGLQLGEDSLFDEIALSRACHFAYDASINSYIYQRRNGSLYTSIKEEDWMSLITRSCALIENASLVKSSITKNIALRYATSSIITPLRVRKERRAWLAKKMIKSLGFKEVILSYLIKNARLSVKIIAMTLRFCPEAISCALILLINAFVERNNHI